jgi:hypothetical protein
MNGSRLPLLAALMIAGLLPACQVAKVADAISGSAQTVSVLVDPLSAEVAPGATVQLVATVTGTADTAVVWSVVEPGGGTIDGSGLFTAPAATGTYHAKATAHADASVSALATLVVTTTPAVQVAIAPRTAAVDACRTATFTAVVTGSADSTVTWSITEGATGGTITAAGIYTAPSTAGTYHVVAASRASPGVRATATVTVSDRVTAVSVSPSSLSLAPGATAQFSATVTTTCGSTVSLQSVTAPL